MSAILKPETLAVFLIFTVPGFVALYIRAQFVTGKLPPTSEALIGYVTLSLVYHGIVFPVLRPLYVIGAYEGWQWAGWFALIFILPAALGFLLGMNVRKGWTKRLIGRVGIGTAHPAPTAWDWFFSQACEYWVIVTLKELRKKSPDDLIESNSKWYGFIGEKSFASSDGKERDLYIECVYNYDGDGGAWEPTGASLWIAHDQIQSIEFLPNIK